MGGRKEERVMWGGKRKERKMGGRKEEEEGKMEDGKGK